MDREREGDGERIGVRGIADGRQNKTREPTCSAAKYSFPYTVNGHSNISQKKFLKNLRQTYGRARKQ